MCLVRRDSPWRIDPLRIPEMGSRGYEFHRSSVGTCTEAADVGLKMSRGQPYQWKVGLKSERRLLKSPTPTDRGDKG